jgi:hypothetical protein
MLIKDKKKFIKNGWLMSQDLFDIKKLNILKNKFNKIIPSENKIFYKNYKTFKSNAKYKNITPGLKEHNILLDKEVNLDFIEKNKKFNNLLYNFFDGEYVLESKWLIKILSKKCIPKWVETEINDIGMPQLNMYVKKYRNTSYMNGLDFHQDNGGKLRDSTTIIIYLNEIKNKNDGPIQILDKSHVLGATTYPHYCRSSSDKKNIYYSDFKGNHILTKIIPILGPAGTTIIFNGYLLHGSTINDDKKKTRLALRYVFSPKKKSKNSLHFKSNRKIFTNSFYIKNYRLDKEEDLYNKKCGKVINYVK